MQGRGGEGRAVNLSVGELGMLGFADAMKSELLTDTNTFKYRLTHALSINASTLSRRKLKQFSTQTHISLFEILMGAEGGVLRE
jgi:hypothetical protein